MSNLSDRSKRMSRIHITDQDYPDVKTHKVGQRQKFLVDAEMIGARKTDPEEMIWEPNMKKSVKPGHTMTGEYQIHSITPHKAKDTTAMPAEKKAPKVAAKGQKVARYKNRADGKAA